MAARLYEFIDCDTHVTESPDVWTSRVAARFKDKVPQIRWVNEERKDYWFLGQKKLVAAGASAHAGWPEPFPGHPPTLKEAHPASYDANARVAYMDKTGCRAQVLYPNIGGFGSQAFLELGDPELMLECVRAYNDFQYDFVSVAPKRFVPIIATPFWDVDATVAEIERCAKRGFRGILFTASPQDYGFPYLADRHWDRLWGVAQDAKLPISFHVGSGDFFSEAGDGYTAKRLEADGFPATYARTAINLFLTNGFQLSDLLFSGVLARFPGVRFVSVESGIGWIPFVLEAADYHARAIDLLNVRPEFTMEPSAYFHRQVYACYWFEKIAPKHQFGEVGVGNILFETDFPHVTCLYENVQETIEAGLGNQPEAVRRRILLENAAELYGLDLD